MKEIINDGAHFSLQTHSFCEGKSSLMVFLSLCLCPCLCLSVFLSLFQVIGWSRSADLNAVCYFMQIKMQNLIYSYIVPDS